MLLLKPQIWKCWNVIKYALLKRIIETFDQLYAMTAIFTKAINQTLENACDRKLRETHKNE